MLTSEYIPFLARIFGGGLLAWAAVWVAFGPEIAQTLGRLRLSVEGRGTTADHADGGNGSAPA
jgi:hypothetical protein